MPTFRKKPLYVTAQQFFRPILSLIVDTPGVCQCPAGSLRGHVHTLHQGQIIDLEDGDWVVAESDGKHYYPIKPAIFTATYEPVEDN